MSNESKITAELRVKSCVVSQFPKPNKRSFAPSKQQGEEVWEVKAEGDGIPYPISLHFTTLPGHKVIAPMGKIKITIEASA
jgi:hypothetical protein